MPRCPRCNHDFIATRDDHLDHYIDPFGLRANIRCPGCGRSFEIWCGEFSK